jgi:hypothetical protein
MFKASNIHYEMSERTAATNCGGIGAMHLMVQRPGLVEDIDRHLHLLKVHLPYHESDHVLNMAYNLLAGGQRLEDIELRRQDQVFLNGLGAERIPDPTTAGDFTRRFNVEDIVALEECINRTRVAVWKVQPKGFLKEAFIDVDGTIAQTYGECKEGMDISYKRVLRKFLQVADSELDNGDYFGDSSDCGRKPVFGVVFGPHEISTASDRHGGFFGIALAVGAGRFFKSMLAAPENRREASSFERGANVAVTLAGFDHAGAFVQLADTPVAPTEGMARLRSFA